jgi:indolepyruvate ferredoxin oxidoreductase
VLVAGVGGTGVVTIGALLGMAAHLDGLGATVLDQTGLAQKGGAVLTHVRLARTPAELYAPRIVTADVLLGCDLLVACGAETLARLQPGATRAVVNSADSITGDIVRHPELGFPHDAALAALRVALGRDDGGASGGGADEPAGDGGAEFDATTLAARLAGHSIAANVLLLGYAWQRGWLPLSLVAIERAIELNAVAAAENRNAFAWGRRLAHAPAAAWRAADAAAGPLPPAPATLDALIARRADELQASHGAAAVRRWRALVERVRDAEQRTAPGSEGPIRAIRGPQPTESPGGERLTRTVLEQAFRLFGAKDEYEAARRLTDPAFEAELARRFEGQLRIHYHLAPPWRRGDALRKAEVGPWARPALRLLAHARRWRGSRFDPLRDSAEHRLDRELADEYEQAIERLLRGLTPDRLDAAVQIAALAQELRGFGRVKAQAAQRWRERLGAALARYDADPAAQPLRREAPIAAAAAAAAG